MNTVIDHKQKSAGTITLDLFVMKDTYKIRVHRGNCFMTVDEGSYSSENPNKPYNALEFWWKFHG